jgi:hypothetical protein
MVIEKIEVAGKTFASVYMDGLNDSAADRVKENPEILRLVRESNLMFNNSGLHITYRDRTLAYSLDPAEGCIQFHRKQRLLAEKATMLALGESLNSAVGDFIKNAVKQDSFEITTYTKPNEK